MQQQRSCFPLVAWDLCVNEVVDAALERWGHFLGPCNRPFGRQSFGLWLADELVAVAVSASTVNAHCGGFKRQECLELARLCAHPEHHDLTRVALRLWRKTAPAAWPHWSVQALVSYANKKEGHSGDIYRFDGWGKVADVPGSSGGGTWSKLTARDPKSVWVYPLGGL